MFPPEVLRDQDDLNRWLSMQIETIEHTPHVELETCPRCGGSGTVHWYLGDEFNSQGYSECEICEGTGMVEK